MSRIPTEIIRDQLLKALQPLRELLNVELGEIVISPPIMIGEDVTFSVVAAMEGDDTTLPEGVVAKAHPQDDEFALLQYGVTVKVVD